jgi:hypothetical protein
MTEEEKLNHLRDWMDIWISHKVLNLQWYSYMINFYKETGNILYNIRGLSRIPTFEEYLAQIKKII